MNEREVDMISQVADQKARIFAGKLGDQPLTMNWVSRYNGFFSGYMCMKADDYTIEKTAEILMKQKQSSPVKAPLYVPPVEESDPFDDLLGVAEGEDLLG